MKFLLRLLVLLFLIKLGYNYFFGNEEQRSHAGGIVENAKDLSHSIGNMIKSEKESYEEGEFNRLLEILSESLLKLRKIDSISLSKNLEEMSEEKDLLITQYQALEFEKDSLRLKQIKSINLRLKELIQSSTELSEQ
jgi:hypothetical protein